MSEVDNIHVIILTIFCTYLEEFMGHELGTLIAVGFL